MKGGTAVTLDKPLIIVCGNRSIAEVYPKCQPYIKARFIEVNVDSEIQIHTSPPKTPWMFTKRAADLRKMVQDQKTMEEKMEQFPKFSSSLIEKYKDFKAQEEEEKISIMSEIKEMIKCS